MPTVREIYERKTGKKWASAKAEGLTDGSYEKNIALGESLKDAPETSFKQKFDSEREAQGPGKTFDFNGKSYTTDRADDVPVKKEEAKIEVKAPALINKTALVKKEEPLKNYFPIANQEGFEYSKTPKSSIKPAPVKEYSRKPIVKTGLAKAIPEKPLKNYFPDVEEASFEPLRQDRFVSERPKEALVKGIQNKAPVSANPVFDKLAGDMGSSYKPVKQAAPKELEFDMKGNDRPVYSYKKPMEQSQANPVYQKTATPKDVPLLQEDTYLKKAGEVMSSVGGFFSDKVELGTNGIKRFLDKRGYTEDTDIKTALRKDPMTAKEYYDAANSSGTQTSLDVAKSEGRTYKQAALSTDQIKWGYRNRGNYKDIKTDGLEITAFEPFSSKNLKEGSSVIALDTVTNTMKAGNAGDFKGKPNYVFAKTYMNKISSFNYDQSGAVILKSGSVSGNSSYQQPTVKTIGKDGKEVIGSLNVLLKNSNSKDYYGSVQGGRILFKDPVTKKTTLVAGSVAHIEKEFKRLKGNSPYLEAYTLDNGTYARGLSNKSKNLTGKDLRSYDNENTSGGNGLYIKSYNSTPSKFEQEIVDNMPNIRNKTDESFKKGHSLRNDQLNMILHHTAYTDSKTSEKAVKKQYMTKGQSSSHVVIQENGKRVIYASPEQVTFHAGESEWQGRDSVNDFGIGVEFQGDTNKKPLTDQQIDSFIEYYDTIATKTKLSLKSIITHQMIAPGRKPDITNKEYQRVLDRLKSTGHK